MEVTVVGLKGIDAIYSVAGVDVGFLVMAVIHQAKEQQVETYSTDRWVCQTLVSNPSNVYTMYRLKQTLVSV